MTLINDIKHGIRQTDGTELSAVPLPDMYVCVTSETLKNSLFFWLCFERLLVTDLKISVPGLPKTLPYTALTTI